MDENKKIICCTNNYLGIGNRLKYLISCLRYYDNPDIIHLIWPSSGWVNCKFKDLFVFNIKTVIKEYEEPNENETISQDLPTNWRLWISPNDHLPRNIKNDGIAKTPSKTSRKNESGTTTGSSAPSKIRIKSGNT